VKARGRARVPKPHRQWRGHLLENVIHFLH
jgi:hypothetical protein